MSGIFIKILNMSISASWLILAVIVIRLIFRKAPKWLMCILWGLVALRLMIPFTPESVLSLIPSNEVIPENITTEVHPQIHSGITYVDATVNPVMESQLSPQIGDSVNPMQVVAYIASLVWCIGVAVCLSYALISFIILKVKVRASKKIMNRVYACDEVRSPFILGVFRPLIYIPSGMNKETKGYVLDHESAHLKRGDHFWKPLGFIILSVYWFNPLCWIAYILLCRDIEFACDEKVIRDMDKDDMVAYSQALLDCSFPRRRIAACPLAFGEVGVRERVRGVLNYRKPAFWVIIIAIVVCIVVAVCFLTNPKDQKISKSFIASITSINENSIYVKPEDGPDELKSADSFAIPMSRLEEKYTPQVGDVLEIFYDGYVYETYPASLGTIEMIAICETGENMDSASYDFHNVSDDTADLNEEHMELNVNMTVIDATHADFLFETESLLQSQFGDIRSIWLYFSGDYYRFVLQWMTDPKDVEDYAFMYDSSAVAAVGKVITEKTKNGIIIHADMSDLGAEEADNGSDDGFSFFNLRYGVLKYQMSSGEEYSCQIDFYESNNL